MAGALALVTGCATQPAPPGSRVVVSAPAAQFYKNGPAEDFTFVDHKFDNFGMEQKIGPDFELPKGTHLTLLKREFGYSRVVTDYGVAGYIANDQLAPAPAVARTTPPSSVGRGEGPFRNRDRTGNPRPPRKIEEPPLDLNDLPLPLPG